MKITSFLFFYQLHATKQNNPKVTIETPIHFITSSMFIRWRKYSCASCCLFVENSWCPRPISVLNIWGRIPDGGLKKYKKFKLYQNVNITLFMSW